MEAKSKIETYLEYLITNKGELPKASNRVDYYLQYLAIGGNQNDLPPPESNMDKYLYELCINGSIGGGSTSDNTGPIGIPIDKVLLKFIWNPPAHYSLSNIPQITVRQLISKGISSIGVKEKEGI